MKKGHRFGSKIRSIFYLIKPYWQNNRRTMVFFICLGGMLPAVATVAAAVYQQTMLECISAGNTLTQIALTAVWLSAVIFLPQLGAELFDILFVSLDLQKTEILINRRIYEKALRSDYVHFDNPEFYNDFSWSVTNWVSRAEESRQLVMRFFAMIITALSLAGLIFVQDMVVILISVIPLAISLFLGKRMNRVLFLKEQDNVKPSRRADYVKRCFYQKQWAADLKTTAVSRYLFRMLDQACSEKLQVTRKFRGRIAGIRTAGNALSFAAQVAITVYLAFRILHGDLSIGSFVGLITASGYFSSNLAQIIQFIQNTDKMTYYADKLRRFDEIASQIEDSRKGGQAITIEEAHAGFSLSLKDVSFSYSASGFGLKNIDMNIEAGQKIAIVGVNGSGKTTLAKLLLRLYDPESGSIQINGSDICGYKLEDLRRYIGIAYQDPALYALSLRENIAAYGEVDADRIRETIHTLGLDTFLQEGDIERMMTREFEDDGLVPSGGQIQKLALARILVNQPFGLLILDEASSALDPLAEYDLNQYIFNKMPKTTTIIISHRLKNVMSAVRIYVMDNGRIVEEGTHEELMTHKGLYCEMFTKQQD